ncbi:hypothetical protein J6590_012759 [Homalodisca vitripennis]|nr:hypothetical protein J6590_012759 [Homalodisca vitripennis]
MDHLSNGFWRKAPPDGGNWNCDLFRPGNSIGLRIQADQKPEKKNQATAQELRSQTTRQTLTSRSETMTWNSMSEFPVVSWRVIWSKENRNVMEGEGAAFFLSLTSMPRHRFIVSKVNYIIFEYEAQKCENGRKILPLAWLDENLIPVRNKRRLNINQESTTPPSRLCNFSTRILIKIPV